MSNVLRFLTSIALCIVALIANASPVDPSELKMPREISCVYLKEPLELTALYGMFNVQWTTRLERGAYWSEKIDEQGTYFRAPAGMISVRGKDGNPFPGQPISFNGGFYVPNNDGDPVTLYWYFSTEATPVQASHSNEDCSTLAYVNDPSASKISLVPFVTAGATGGAAGGVIGRSMASNPKMSYGQAAGAGAVGGAIAGVIIESIINSDVGKVLPVNPRIKDLQFLEKLRTLAAKKIILKEIPPSAPASAAQ